ncbi:uncharacterized protein P884DRAFT_76176 [Thermothelomyces heterothallicus CBS 202.75]|uniref:uncharacterized protein n=1 Tax=Thermothelomyces heterothallicus CBS 202.75 TaxID=1149848 RepID=UPI0037438CBC
MLVRRPLPWPAACIGRRLLLPVATLEISRAQHGAEHGLAASPQCPKGRPLTVDPPPDPLPGLSSNLVPSFRHGDRRVVCLPPTSPRTLRFSSSPKRSSKRRAGSSPHPPCVRLDRLRVPRRVARTAHQGFRFQMSAQRDQNCLILRFLCNASSWISTPAVAVLATSLFPASWSSLQVPPAGRQRVRYIQRVHRQLPESALVRQGNHLDSTLGSTLPFGSRGTHCSYKALVRLPLFSPCDSELRPR